MKDIPHHIKKLNRRIIRSMHREGMEEQNLPEIPTWAESRKEKRKKQKVAMKKTRNAHVPTDSSPDERNKIMKGGRVPIFRYNNQKPKQTPPSGKKKTRRI